MKKYLLIIVLFLVSCTTKQQFNPIVKTRVLMGTFVQISVYNNIPSVDQIIDEAFQTISQVEQYASSHSDSSVVNQINNEAGNNFIEIDTNLSNIIRQAQKISEISEGAFDISIGPLLNLWNFEDPNPKLPEEKDIQQAKLLVNYQDILLNNFEIKLKKLGMKIDLSGIAKGYAVDKAMDVLLKHGIKDALVDAGGDFKSICSELTKGKRRVWIKHPRQRNRLFGYFKMDDGCVATSGDYEQYFFIDSVRYHHIIDPKTGYPANKCISVTIQADNTTLADGLATAVFLLGPEKGMNLIDQLDDVEGVIIYEKEKKLEYICSRGLTGKFYLTETQN